MSHSARSLLRSTVAAILGAAAGVLIAVALYSAFPDCAPRGSLPALVAACAALVSCAAILWDRVAVLAPRRELVRLVGSALVALILVLLFWPEPSATWRFVGNREDGRVIRFVGLGPAWGVRPGPVTNFHASVVPDGRDLPWRRGAATDARGLSAFGPVRFGIHATQPEGALLESKTHARKTEIDGVTGFVKVRRHGAWTTIGRIDLEPTASGWTDIEVEVPRGSDRVALEWDARGNMNSDYVLVAIDGPKGDVLGIRRGLVLGFGELLLLTLGLALASFLVLPVVALLGRLSACPDAAVEPGRFRFRPLDGLALAVVLLAPLPVAVQVAPWLDAATTPIVIDWAAPEGASVEVGFGDGPGEHVPGVRLDPARFAAELPPRPVYRLSLRLSCDVSRGVMPPGGVSVLDSRDARVVLTIPARELQLRSTEAAGPAGAETAESRATAQLVYAPEIRVGRTSHAAKIGAVWLGGACALAVLFLALRLLARRPTTNECSGPVDPAPLFPIALSAIMVACVTTVWALSVPTVVSDDTMNYLQKGEAIARTGSFDTGFQSGELVRTPGFPAFLAVIIKVWGHSYTAVAVAQGLLLSLALFLAAASLRTRVRTGWLVAGVFLGGTLLPCLHFARLMMSESVFISESLIALACFWAAQRAAPTRSVAWMAAFGVATGIAAYTRLIGVALLAVPAVTWLSGTIALCRRPAGWSARVLSVARYSIPYLLTVAIVGASIFAWCKRNERARGYFGFAAMASLSNLQGELHAGTLDPRALVPIGFYDRFVRKRASERYVWSVWHIYGDIFEKAEAQVGSGRKLIQRAEDIYERLYQVSKASAPLAGRLVKFLRSGWWNLAFTGENDYIGSTKTTPEPYWDLWLGFEEARSKKAWLDDALGIPMSVHASPLTRIGDLFLWEARWYPSIHPVLLCAALLGCLLMLAAGRPGLAAPFVFVAANWVLLTYLRQHEVRYMIILDVFCVLQIVLALGSPRRALT